MAAAARDYQQVIACNRSTRIITACRCKAVDARLAPHSETLPLENGRVACSKTIATRVLLYFSLTSKTQSKH